MKEVFTPKPMRRSDIRPCDICKGTLGLNPVRLRVERHIVDIGAAQRAMGLEMQFGGGTQGAVLAAIMGPDEDLTIPIPSFDILVCADCQSKSLDEFIDVGLKCEEESE